MLAPYVVTNNFSGTVAGSLGLAVQQANQTAGADTITFNLSAAQLTAGITLNATLQITDAVTIVGPAGTKVPIKMGVTTQNAFVIDATLGGTASFKLENLAISGFAGDAILVTRLPNGGNLELTSLEVKSNGDDGIQIATGSNNNYNITVSQCTIEGNATRGIHIFGGGSAQSNLSIDFNTVRTHTNSGVAYMGYSGPIKMYGNNIGINDNAQVGSNTVGVLISNSNYAPTGTVTNVGEFKLNTISGNEGPNETGAGLRVASSQQPYLSIDDNNFGTTVLEAVTASSGNDRGLDIQGATTVLGLIQNNDIAGNDTQGILIDTSDLGSIVDNDIFSNVGDGILLQNGANDWTLQSNRIGGTSAAQASRGNGRSGLRIVNSARAVVGFVPGAPTQPQDVSVFGYNGADGITVTGASAVENAFIGNLQFIGNADLPIDLGDNGRTPNNSPTNAPNRNLNYLTVPVRTIKQANGNWQVPFEIQYQEAGTYYAFIYRVRKDTNGVPFYDQIVQIPFNVSAAQAAGNVLFESVVEIPSGFLVSGDQISVGTVDFQSPNLGNSSELSPVSVPIAQLVGDYNRNGVVNAADYTVWRDARGQTVAPFAGADGNGDGLVNDADYALWKSNYGAGTSLSGLMLQEALSGAIGDYNRDGAVDHNDYILWAATYASTTDLRADGNSDGVVDAADYTLWRDQVGSTLQTIRLLAANQATGIIYVVTTFQDDYDGNYEFGDLSFREAVQLANAAGGPATIILNTGKYDLTRVGSESGASVAFNDLDITGNVQVIGNGAGFTIIDISTLTGSDDRAFDILAGGAALTIRSVTVANGAGTHGQLARVADGSDLTVLDSAIVNHTTDIGGVAIVATNADVVIRRSVFTNNDNTLTYGGAAVKVIQTGSGAASITVGESIFAFNVQPGYYAGYDTKKGVEVAGTVTKTNDGKNLYDNASGGFFDTTTGIGDFLGTPDYVVTSLADNFNHTDDHYSLSIREAVDLANLSAGIDEIWLPAWAYTLTRDRLSYGGGSATDIDVSFGDIDVKDQLVVRGVLGLTSVQWTEGVVDSVFDLLGDFNQDGQSVQDTDSADYTVWADENGAGTGTVADWEVYEADGDDDGDVDAADHAIWSTYYGNSLDLFGVSA
jgi:hypothetical protein